MSEQTAIFCGDGCACLTVCGDYYDHSGLPRPPERSCRLGCNGCEECTDYDEAEEEQG